MLDAISDCLTELRVNYIRIDGQTRSDVRADYVDTFQKKSSCKVAVLSLKACNSGITLTAAEMIVFAELDWNPSVCIERDLLLTETQVLLFHCRPWRRRRVVLIALVKQNL